MSAEGRANAEGRAEGGQADRVRLGDELALVISNETTVKVLVMLIEQRASPKDIAAHLKLTIPRVSHHIKKLRDLGLIECVDEVDVGGAIQHFYRAVVRPIVSTEEWSKLSLAERQKYSIWIVRMILADAAISFEAELFDALPNRHLSRTPLLLDDEGFDKVAEIQNRALDEILEVESEAGERMAHNGATGSDSIAAMTCFPLPGESQWLRRNVRERPEE